MLSTLRIKNLALVTDLTLELQPGFNAITGETGAGKSIIIGALDLLLGERADRTLIRSGCDSCSVEAVLEVGRLRASLSRFFAENGLEPGEDNQMVLKRVFTANGVNRQFINGSPTTLNVLRTLGEALVDIHGPHDHQSLFQPARQLAILDAFGKQEKGREAFAALLRRRQELEAERAGLMGDERTAAQQQDLVRFQVNEIAAARLQPEEEQQVEQQYQRASNAARLLQLSQSALGLLSENESCLLTQARALGRVFQELARLDSTAANLAALQEQAVGELQDLQAILARYAERIDLDPARLQELEQRLNLIHALKRKYGSSVPEVLAFAEEARQRLEKLEQRGAELERIQAQLRQVKAELWRAGQELSAQRRRVIPNLCKAAREQLADLGFTKSSFEVSLTSVAGDEAESAGSPVAADGLDTIEFVFAPNPGEPAKPLRAIASSGEMARVMLALKTVLAAVDAIPVLVFDEVDANVGGETAQALGEKMREISQQHQVLCITHLASVAASAATHFVVTKQVKEGRTVSTISALNKAERVAELSRMLGGQSPAAHRHAEAMLAAASK